MIPLDLVILAQLDRHTNVWRTYNAQGEFLHEYPNEQEVQAYAPLAFKAKYDIGQQIPFIFFNDGSQSFGMVR